MTSCGSRGLSRRSAREAHSRLRAACCRCCCAIRSRIPTSWASRAEPRSVLSARCCWASQHHGSPSARSVVPWCPPHWSSCRAGRRRLVADATVAHRRRARIRMGCAHRLAALGCAGSAAAWDAVLAHRRSFIGAGALAPLATLAVGSIVVAAFARDLNALVRGELSAAALGVSVRNWAGRCLRWPQCSPPLP